jgi:hypothetical protein
MGILGSGDSAPKEFGVKINESSYGDPYITAMGTVQVQQQVLWVDGFSSKKAPSKGGGKGGGKSGEYIYSANVVAALCNGVITGIGDVWSGQTWIGSPTAAESYTISSGTSYQYTPTQAAAFYNLTGVGVSNTFSSSNNDFGAPSPTVLSGSDLAPMTQVSFGTTLTTGLFSINPTGNVFNFSSADAGRAVTITYTYLLTNINRQETDIVPSGKTISVTGDGSGSTVNNDYGVVYTLTGVAFTKVSGTPTVAGTYSVSGNNPAVYKFATGDINAEVTISFGVNDPNAVSPGQPTSLNYTLNTGAAGQTPFSFLTSNYPDAAFSYPFVATVLFQPMDLGEGAELQENRYEVITPDIVGGGIADCNPVQCIGKVLTNAQWGLGVGKVPFPTQCIDNGASGTWGGASGTPGARSVASTAYNWFSAQSFFISPLMDSQDSVSDSMSKWLEAGMCAAFYSEGLMKLTPYGDTSAAGNGCTWTAPSNFIVALDDTIFVSKEGTDPVKITRSSPSDAWNIVQVEFDNRSNQYAAQTITESDQSFIDRWGAREEDKQEWNFIHTIPAATFAANLRLKRNLYIRNSYEFTLPYSYSYLEPMDIVTISTTSVWAAALNNANLGITNLPVRIQKIVDDPIEGLHITCEDYPFGAHQPVLYNKQLTTSTPVANAFADPGNTEAVIFGATSALALAQSGAVTGDEIWMGALGTSATWGSCNIYVSQTSGGDYQSIGSINSPAKIGELAATFASHASPDTTDSLIVNLVENCAGWEAGSTTDANFNNTLVFVDNEICSYSALSYTGQDQITMNTYITRGLYGTTIASHSTGGLVMRLDSSIFKYNFPPQWRGQTIFIKFQSVNNFGNMAQDLSTLTPVSFTVPSGNNGSIDAGTGLIINLGAQLYQGLWNSTTAYLNGNIVSYNGSLYQCLVSNTNEVPATQPTYWVLFSDPTNASGFQMVSNPDFQNGLTNYNPYDNNNTGNISLSLVANTAAPGGFGQTLQIHVAGGGESPGLGGFYYATNPDSGVVELDHYHVGDIYNVTLTANIPTAYSVGIFNNSVGTGGSITPLSANYQGTGGWAQYSWQVVIGTSPSILAFPFFALSGTFTSAFNWYAAQVSIVDILQPERGNQNIYLGAWVSTTTYVPGNVVTLGGNNYTCILNNLNQTPPNATYWVLGTVNPATGGVISQGSLPPVVSGALTYSATTSSIEWTWTSLALLRSDGTTTSITNGNETTTGLSASTTYFSFPYYSDTLGTVGFANGGSGSNGFEYTAAQDTSSGMVATQTQNLNANVALSNGSMSAATTSSGTGGGSGGGSGICPRSTMLVHERTRGIIMCRDLRVGDWIATKEGDGWTQVVACKELAHSTFIRVLVAGEYLQVTPTHPFTGLDATGEPIELIRAGDLTLSHQLYTVDGADFVESIEVIRDPEATKLKISCEPYHTFFAGEEEPYILTHNVRPIGS